MSAIFGIWHINGEPVGVEHLRRVQSKSVNTAGTPKER
jgi:hypothetical protein